MAKRVDDYKDVFGMWRKSLQVDGEACHTVSGTTWKNIVSRAKHGGSGQVRRPTYVGCSMSDNFKDFQYFADWNVRQVGYGGDYSIDKDLLFAGNREYSETACVYVPVALNSFLTLRGNARGDFKIGVSWSSRIGRYLSQMTVDGEHVYLGCFITEEGAHTAYKVAKEAEARRWYKRLLAGEYIVDPRVTERMRTWELESE